MQVQNQDFSLSHVLSKRYQNPIEKIDSKEDIALDISANAPIKDELLLSNDYQKIKDAKQYIQGALKNKTTFLALADRLKSDAIINPQEKIAMEFLANKSSNIDFESFKKLEKHHSINFEMQQMLNRLIQKLQMINAINGGIMIA